MALSAAVKEALLQDGGGNAAAVESPLCHFTRY